MFLKLEDEFSRIQSLWHAFSSFAFLKISFHCLLVYGGCFWKLSWQFIFFTGDLVFFMNAQRFSFSFFKDCFPGIYLSFDSSGWIFSSTQGRFKSFLIQENFLKIDLYVLFHYFVYFLGDSNIFIRSFCSQKLHFFGLKIFVLSIL